MADDISSATLEERKLALDELKEQHDYELRTRELELKRTDSNWVARLFTPLTTTILAGIITFGASAVGTLIQSRNALELETRKEQHELILKMVSVGDEKQARANLKFLAETELIDKTLADRVLAVKDTPVLPSPGISTRSSSRDFEAVQNDDEALKLVISWEGGFVQDPTDPENSTNAGITLTGLSLYLGRQATLDELRNLSPGMIRDYYLSVLAPALGISTPIVRAAFLNLAVWIGRGPATQVFQAAAGKVGKTAVVQDGVFGPASIAGINAASSPDPLLFVETANCLILDQLKAMPSWPKFRTNWLQRLRAFSPEKLRGVCPDLQAAPVDTLPVDDESESNSRHK